VSNTTETRQEFVIRLRTLPRVNGIRALRRLLKYGLRACGLRAVVITEESVTQSADESPTNAQNGQKAK
jgi:hypothetical protein